VALDVAKQQEVHKGLSATVTLPDGSTVAGVVATVGTVATTSGAGNNAATTIPVLVQIKDQKALGTLDAAPVIGVYAARLDLLGTVGATNEVQVSRPSDVLAAKQATDKTFTGLLLGLGTVALLVGGVGVANTMVISVLERPAEIGLRRSLGATRGQIRLQFLVESQLLSALGGVGGVLLGVAVTTVYAQTQGWPSVVPARASLGGIGATLVIGAVAGLYPAIRASRLAPTEALGAQ
jgi:ABC-type antimicrobial peptide transport system permease subunit